MKAKRIREQNSIRLMLTKAEALSLWRILSRSHLGPLSLSEQIARDEPVSFQLCRAIANTGLRLT